MKTETSERDKFGKSLTETLSQYLELQPHKALFHPSGLQVFPGHLNETLAMLTRTAATSRQVAGPSTHGPCLTSQPPVPWLAPHPSPAPVLASIWIPPQWSVDNFPILQDSSPAKCLSWSSIAHPASWWHIRFTLHYSNMCLSELPPSPNLESFKGRNLVTFIHVLEALGAGTRVSQTLRAVNAELGQSSHDPLEVMSWGLGPDGSGSITR